MTAHIYKSGWKTVGKIYVYKSGWKPVLEAYVYKSGWKRFFASISLPVPNSNDLISIRTGGYNGTVATSPQYINTVLYGHDGSYTNYTSISKDRKSTV